MDNASEPNKIKQDKTAEDENKEGIEKSQQETINNVEDENKIKETLESEEIPESEEDEKESEKQLLKDEKEKTQKQEQKKVTQVKVILEKGSPEKKYSKKKTDDDFQYIVRIANTDIDGNKKVVHGLTMIKGVGMHISNLIADNSGIDREAKIGSLSDLQIDKIRKTLGDLNNNAPGWMLNHRKDYETGENIHLIGSDIDMRLRDEINIMKKIRSYRGIRHERALRVRGQRTRANNRKGLALGVSKRRE